MADLRHEGCQCGQVIAPVRPVAGLPDIEIFSAFHAEIMRRNHRKGKCQPVPAGGFSGTRRQSVGAALANSAYPVSIDRRARVFDELLPQGNLLAHELIECFGRLGGGNNQPFGSQAFLLNQRLPAPSLAFATPLHDRAPRDGELLDIRRDSLTNPMEPACPAAALVYNNPLCTYRFRSTGQRRATSPPLTGPASKARPPAHPALPGSL